MSTSAEKQGQARDSERNFVRYHGMTPPPKQLPQFVGRERAPELIDLDFAVAAMARALLATHPVVALCHWRIRAERLHVEAAR